MPGRLIDTASMESPSADISTANRRVSSRARRPKEHYASSPAQNGKRKRSGNAVQGDNEEDEEDAEVDESEDDSSSAEELDEDERREQAKRARKRQAAPAKRPAQKKPKTNGLTLPIRAARAPAKKKVSKKNAYVGDTDAEAAGGIFADIFAHHTAIESIIASWITAFPENEAESLAHLVNFALRCTGCTGEVTQHDIEDADAATNRITDLQEEYQASQPTEYPLIAKGRQAVTFKNTLCEFFETFIRTIGANGLLVDQPPLIENIQAWFSTMTSATNRAFRHTSTIICLSIITALCDVASDYASKVNTNQRQAESERKKARVNKERVKNLEAKVAEASKHRETVEAHLKDWFETIFIHRYRDVDATIRRECVIALGDWMEKMPDAFFDGQHLRYMGWLLSDAHAGTRLEDLKQLRRLYCDGDKIGGLKTFTERFRERMVEIATSDSDVSVRIAGIELLDLLRENGLLEPDDIDAAGRLMFHDEPRIRRAIAPFFAQNVNDLYESKVEELGGDEVLEESLPEVADENMDTPRLEWLKFKSLAETLNVYDSEEALLPANIERSRVDGSLILHANSTDSRFTLAVDTLYSRIDELQEWQALAGYLLHEKASSRAHSAADDVLTAFHKACALEDSEEVVMLEVLTSSVKHNLKDIAEKVAGAKIKMTKREKEDLNDEEQTIVRTITDILPKLFKRFGDVPSTAAAILRLEAMLAQSPLQQLRHDAATNVSLLTDLSKQFMSHGTDEVLAPATSAILLAKSYGELDDTALDKINSLWEEVVSNLSELLDIATITVRGATTSEELVALSNNLLRIVRLSTISDCTSPLEDSALASGNGKKGKKYNGAIDFIIDLVQRAMPSATSSLDQSDSAIEDEIAARAAEAALSYFRWQFTAIIASITSGSSSDAIADRLEAIAERRDTFANNIQQALTARKPVENVSAALAGCLLDLYTSAAVLRTISVKPGTSDDYTALILELDTTDERTVLRVFNAVEKDFAKLTRRTITTSDHIAVYEANADPVDDDPMSDPESSDSEDEDDGLTTIATAGDANSQERRNAKRVLPLLAEERLCKLTAKLIYAILAGVISNGPTRRRLERNRTRLGPNYREVIAYLDIGKVAAKKGGKKAIGKAASGAKSDDKTGAGKGKKSAKSHALVAEDEEDDEIEDVDDVEEQENEEVPDDGDDVAMGEADSIVGD